MKIKEIWIFIKTVLWPAAKPFICMTHEEAVELKYWMEAYRPMKSLKSEVIADDNIMPAFYRRLKEALENE
jgi:hypothetical protein